MGSRIRDRRRDGLQRGVSLIEILIVIAIMALIAGAVGINAMNSYKDAKLKTAAAGAHAVRDAVKGWWLAHDETLCPTAAQLLEDRLLEDAKDVEDPWGRPWRIACTDDRAIVSSDGPDRKPGTPDDIRFPPKSS